MVLCNCGFAAVPVVLTGVVLRLPEVRERLNDGATASVGKYCERASRTRARASMKFSKNCFMFWLLMLSCSSRALSSGSLKISHHLPRSLASAGCATVQGPLSLNWVVDSLYAGAGAWGAGA